MTPLVLIPGFMCDARLFGPQIAALEATCDIRVPVPREPSISEMAATILATMDRPSAVAGLSMGGIVALEMLRQAPDAIERLALMDTTPLADATQNHAIRTRQIAEVRAGALDRIMQDELKPAYLHDSERKKEIFDLCLEMARDLGSDVFEAQALALRDRDDLRTALADAPRNTLILYGEGDRLCPPERHRMMHARMPHATLVSIPRAGHLPTLERPRAVRPRSLHGWQQTDPLNGKSPLPRPRRLCLNSRRE